MANTRDVIGEKATLAGIVGNTLTSLEDDGVTEIGEYVLSHRTALASVKFPNVTRIRGHAFEACNELAEITADFFPALTHLHSQAFYSCRNLTAATFSSGVELLGQAFYSCPLTKIEFSSTTNKPRIMSSAFSYNNALDTVIIRYVGDDVPFLESVNAFYKTKIAILEGAIYVPSNMVSKYEADQKWSNFFIASVDRYPLTDYGSISDSWDTIISYANAGTIGDHYAVNDTKKLTIDGVIYYAQLVGINKDTLSSDGTTKANSTWMLRNLLTTTANGQRNAYMNAMETTVGGWAESDMRKNTLPAILQTFPANLQSAIKSVNKVSYRFEDTSEQITADKLWIPSSQEVNLTGNYLKETTGVVYDGVFTDDNSRRRYYKNGNEYYYKLRSAYSSTNFVDIAYGGSGNNNQASTSSGILLGFCI